MGAHLLGLMVPALLVASCGADDEDGVGADRSLDGRTFLSVAVTEAGSEFPLVPGTTVRLEFADGEIRVQAGCNHLFGTLESTDGGRLAISPMGGTEMGCDAVRHAQDDWIASFLMSGPSWTLDGDRLVLTSDTIKISFLDREVADPDLALEGTRWLVDTILSGEAASSTPGNGSVVRFTDWSRTDVMCEPDAMSMEGAVLAALAGQVEFTIEAQRLTMVAPSGEGLGFHAEQ